MLLALVGLAFAVILGSWRLADGGGVAPVTTIPVGASPGAIAVDAQTGRAFIANQGSNTVSVLDVRRGTIVRTVAVGVSPQAVAVDGHAGHVFVLNRGSNSLSMLDARSGALLRTLHIAQAPQAVAVDERRRLVFVASLGPTDHSGTPAGNGRLSLLDGQTGKAVRTVAVGVAPVAVGVDERSGRVIVVNAGGRVRAPAAWWQQWLQRIVPGIPQPAPTTRNVPGSFSVVDEARVSGRSS